MSHNCRVCRDKEYYYICESADFFCVNDLIDYLRKVRK